MLDDLSLFSVLPTLLLPWYRNNKRDLPWRQDRDPYHIWISEIMLQQTRVEAVRGYYARFIKTLPTIDILAKADDNLLQKLWEGLGYYTRVKNLKKAAVEIVNKFHGVFPQDYSEILSLPGIGEYTAGAISSIAFGQRVPAVDGNVLRVASRLLDDATPIDTPAFRKRIRQLLLQTYPSAAGDYTQALMELGATVCGPNRKPECENCPCASICKANLHGTAESLPVKSPKRNRRLEEKTVFILRCDGKYALEKRPTMGLLADLWQFPNCDGKLGVEQAVSKMEEECLPIKEIFRQVERKHVFTHVEWDMRGIYMEVSVPDDKYVWLTAEQVEQETALPTAFRQFWEEINYV